MKVSKIMSRRIRLNNTLMDNIWLLYEKGVSKSDIVKLLGISNASVCRVIKAFETASKGIMVRTDSEFKDCKHIAVYANAKFELYDSHCEEQRNEDIQNMLFDVLSMLDEIKNMIRHLL